MKPSMPEGAQVYSKQKVLQRRQINFRGQVTGFGRRRQPLAQACKGVCDPALPVVLTRRTKPRFGEATTLDVETPAKRHHERPRKPDPRLCRLEQNYG
jgi:hypothetical protein